MARGGITVNRSAANCQKPLIRPSDRKCAQNWLEVLNSRVRQPWCERIRAGSNCLPTVMGCENRGWSVEVYGTCWAMPPYEFVQRPQRVADMRWDDLKGIKPQS